MKKIELKITGMHCANCARSITKALEKDPDIKSANTSFAAGQSTIEYDDSLVSLDKIKKIVLSAGYGVKDDNAEPDPAADRRLWIKTWLAIGLSLPLFAHMFWMWHIPGSTWGASHTDWLQLILAAIVVFVLGRQFHLNAWRALKARRADMDALISLGTLSAFFYSAYAMFTDGHLYFESAAVITALILLGRLLEAKTRGRAGRAMEKLLSISAKTATVIGPNKERTEKPIDRISVGEVLLIRSGDKVPLDALILSGTAAVDESMLTGEPLPVAKETGKRVFAGTLVQDGVLSARVEKDGESTLLASIIRTVMEAQNYKAPAQRLADRIAEIFVPIVIALSAVTGILWWLINGDFASALLSAVAVLIISCPCALGIATPVAIMAGSLSGARQGILVKNGASLEKAKNIDALLLDKTGTLTEGRPRVSALTLNDSAESSREQVLKVACSLAVNSTHPLSQAIAAYAAENGTKPVELRDLKEIPGEGLEAQCQKHGTRVALGNRRLLDRLGLEPGDLGQEPDKSPGTMVYAVHGQTVIGALAVSDALRPRAAAAMSAARRIGLEPMLVSGDTEANVKETAASLGISAYFHSVLPAGKRDLVLGLQKQGRKVAFAGDGINDAPALAQADLGLAMASGTDIAKEAGDIVILSGHPDKIVTAVKLSRLTFKIIKQNLFWAFFYNAAAIPLAMLGLINPMIAAAAMSLSSLSVIGNSLRIYRR